jgi:hypothetical protein
MKSALELAMEKTEKLLSKQSAGLSDAQKKRIAEIEAECRAKVAEAEIMLEGKMRDAVSGDPGSAEAAVLALREEHLRDKETWAAKRDREVAKVKEKRG